MLLKDHIQIVFLGLKDSQKQFVLEEVKNHNLQSKISLKMDKNLQNISIKILSQNLAKIIQNIHICKTKIYLKISLFLVVENTNFFCTWILPTLRVGLWSLGPLPPFQQILLILYCYKVKLHKSEPLKTPKYEPF